MSGARQYCTFYADPFHFAFDVDQVQEVVQPVPVTPVPLTTNVVDGLVNLRGQILPAIDLRARLDLPQRAQEEPSVSLIVRTNSGLVSLRADRLGDVLDCGDPSTCSQFATGTAGDSEQVAGSKGDGLVLDRLPDTVRGPVRELALGVIQLDQSLLLVLDPDLLLIAAACLLPNDAAALDYSKQSQG